MPCPYPSNKNLCPQQLLTMCCCWDVCTKISMEVLIFKNMGEGYGKFYGGVILGSLALLSGAAQPLVRDWHCCVCVNSYVVRKDSR